MRGGLAALEAQPAPPDLDYATLAEGFLSTDLKTSPVAASSSRPSAAVRVTTWLPSGLDGSCPGASPYCLEHCYACRLEACRPSLARLVDRRLEVWQSLEPGPLMTLCAAICQAAHRMQTRPNRGAAHYGGPPVRPILRIGGGGARAPARARARARAPAPPRGGAAPPPPPAAQHGPEPCTGPRPSSPAYPTSGPGSTRGPTASSPAPTRSSP